MIEEQGVTWNPEWAGEGESSAWTPSAGGIVSDLLDGNDLQGETFDSGNAIDHLYEPLVSRAQAQVQAFHETFGHPVGVGPDAMDLQSEEAFDRLSARGDWIQEEVDEYRAAVHAGDMVEVVDALVDILYFVYGTAVELGVNLTPAFDEVHRSNMAKVWGDGLVHYREDGKVQKPEGWLPPDIGAVLETQGWTADEELEVGE